MSPAQADKSTRRTQILQAATLCFARKGYHLTRMDDIVQESGLSKGSLYWHFSSKKEILLTLLTDFFAGFAAEFKRLVAISASPAAQLQALGQSVINQFGRQDPLFAVTIDFYAETRHDPEVYQAIEAILLPFIDMLSGVIEKGVALGEFRAVDPRNTAVAILAGLDGIFLYQMILTDHFDWATGVQQFIDLQLAGLRCGVESTGSGA